MVDSDLECPELIVAPVNEAEADIRILLEDLPEFIDRPLHVSPHVQVGVGVYQFQLDGIARYRIEAGRDIRVAPFPGSDPGDVRLYLLGTAIGAVLHQQGRLPLHACAVAVNGGVHAFCGDSGAGKSTLAAAFLKRGLPLLSDDVGLAAPDGAGGCLFYPGFPRIKLWRDALDHFAITSGPLVHDLTRADKYHLMLHDTFHREPLPFKGLYELATEVGEARVEKLSHPATIGLLLRHTYRPGMVRCIGDPATHMSQCGRVAKVVRGYRYHRPWDLKCLDVSLDCLLAHLDAGPA